MWSAFIWIFAGFVLLIVGANGLVNGASALARKFQISELVIGLTIVAFGTSTPELVVNVISSLQGHSDFVVGNVVGSNNFNLFVILGISGLLYPIKVQSSTAWREIPLSLGAAVLLLLAANFFPSHPLTITRAEGVVLGLCFVAFLGYVFRQLQQSKTTITESTGQSGWVIASLVIGGLSGLVIGGHLVVKHSVEVARMLGMSEKLIGLTLLAAGTSLPELVTSVVAAARKNSDIAIGNVIGSNLFNALFILPVSSLLHPVAYNNTFNLDLGLLIGGTALLLLAMKTGKQRALDRWEAGVLLLIYLLYTLFLIVA